MQQSNTGRTIYPKIGVWYREDTGHIHLSLEGQGFSTVNDNPISERGHPHLFAKSVSADHYIFTGNGENGNPELSVIDLIYQSRLGKPAQRTLDPRAAGRKFKFWFSTTSAAQEPGSNEQKVYKAVEKHVGDLVAASNGMLSAAFNSGTSITLTP